MYDMIQLTDAELDAVSGGQGDSPTFNFGNQKDNVIAVIVAVNVGDVSVLNDVSITV